MAVTVSYAGTPPSSPGSSAGVGTTFSSQAIGTAAADRRVVVVWIGIQNSATAATVTCTIGGTSATLVLRVQGGADSGGNSAVMAIFELNVAAGTTATIVTTSNQTMFDNTIYVYAVYGASGGPTHNAQTSGNTNTTLLSLDINVAASGCIIAGTNTYNQSSGPSHTWTGATQDGSLGLYGSDLRSAAHYVAGGAESPRTVSVGIPGLSGLLSYVGASVSYDPSGAAATSLPVFRRPRRFYTRPFSLLKPRRPALITPAQLAA